MHFNKISMMKLNYQVATLIINELYTFFISNTFSQLNLGLLNYFMIWASNIA